MQTNLLNITTIPIDIEINIRHGEFQNPHTPPPTMKASLDPGGFTIEAEPAKINIDTYAARSSMGYGHYNYTDFNKTEAQKSIRIAYEGVARIVNEGDQLVKGTKVSDIAKQNNRAGYTIQTVMEFLPKENADVTFENGKLSLNYQLSDLNVDWENLEVSKLQFIPGAVEFQVKQYPRVEIEYIGGPIYVPRSADPEYQLDTRG